MLKKLLVSAMGAAALVAATPAFAAGPLTTVGLELVLLVDVSGSVDGTEYALQKTGYVNAFNNVALWNAIAGSQLGQIAVTYIEWSGAGQQSIEVGWTLINSQAAAQGFATAISTASRNFSGLTAPGTAINFAVPLFGTETGGADNGFSSLRQVIDVSGDGSQNDGANTAAARNAALAAGVDAINGLPILGSEANLQTWYQNNIQGGATGFTIAATSFATFEAAVLQKLTKEITVVPEPASLALVGLGLLGAGLARRRALKKA